MPGTVECVKNLVQRMCSLLDTLAPEPEFVKADETTQGILHSTTYEIILTTGRQGIK